MALRLLFKCDHVAPFSEKRGDVCPFCGTRGVTAILADSPDEKHPRFTGTCSGPHATTVALEPIAVNLAPGGALVLKDVPHA
jgi:hypothetical protein